MASGKQNVIQYPEETISTLDIVGHWFATSTNGFPWYPVYLRKQWINLVPHPYRDGHVYIRKKWGI